MDGEQLTESIKREWLLSNGTGGYGFNAVTGVYEDLYAAGAVLGCYDYVAEKSGMGVAITTAYKAALSVLGR